MSECVNIEKEIKQSLSETALEYFLNTTEKNEWIEDYAKPATEENE